MNLLGQLWRKLRAHSARGLERDIAEEIQTHLEIEVQENIAAGMLPAEARHSARRKFGNLALAKEDTRSVWRFGWLDSLSQDLRYALRQIRHSPGFAVVAVVSLSLGMWANTTVFSVYDFLLQSELPVTDQDTLVTIHRVVGDRIQTGRSYPEYLDVAAQYEVFSRVAAHFPVLAANLGGPSAKRIWGGLVSSNFFETLGVEPIRGRTFLPSENENPGEAAVVVLSHRLWQRHFDAGEGIIGRSILLNNRPFTVVGVAPPGFNGINLGLVGDFWVPIMMREQLMGPSVVDVFRTRDSRWLYLTGRLKPGISIDQAHASMAVLMTRLEEQRIQEQAAEAGRDQPIQPAAPQWTTLVEPLNGLEPATRRMLTPALATVMTLVALVLLIACANVANLLLARSGARRREFGIRCSLGAGRRRLVRQMLTESFLLALLGGTAGVALAFWTTRVFSQLDLPLPIPVEFVPSVNLHALAFAFGLCLAATLLFGLAPAVEASRAEPERTLKGPESEGGRPRRVLWRNGLVVAQVALCGVILIATGLLIKSLRSAHRIDIGFEPDSLLLASFDPSGQGEGDAGVQRFLGAVQEGVASLPGIRSASLTHSVPLSIGGTNSNVALEGRTLSSEQARVSVYRVQSRFFETVGIPILRGRDFRERESLAPLTAIINETMAQRLWPGQNPIGRTFTELEEYQVIGVVKDSKSRSLGEPPLNCVYFPLSQSERKADALGITLIARTDGDPLAMVPAVRQVFKRLDPNLPLFNIKTMNEHLGAALFIARSSAALFSVCGFVGLVLAATGLFGVIHYRMRRRTKEIGIRMALGARRGDVLTMVLGHGLRIATLGIALGLAVALIATRVLTGVLYGISPHDPLTFAAVPALLLTVALFASLIPARRAAKVDPMVALRYE